MNLRQLPVPVCRRADMPDIRRTEEFARDRPAGAGGESPALRIAGILVTEFFSKPEYRVSRPPLFRC